MFANINNTKLYFDVEGRELVCENGAWKKREVCFVLHGGPGGELTGFGDFLSPLSESMQLVYIDQRGCGRSNREPIETYKMSFNVEDLEALRIHFGLEKITLLGHSYGGMVAQSYAIAYPEHVSNLILVATSPSHIYGKQAMETIHVIGTPDQIHYATLLFENKLVDPNDYAGFKIAMDPLYSYRARLNEKTEEEIAALRAKKVTFNLEVGSAGNEFLQTFDLREDLSKVTCPTLIISGRHDWITPIEASQSIHEHIPQSELVIFEESCHYIFIDELEKFITTIEDFILQKV